MSEFPKTGRNQVRRQSSRGKYDRETVYAILDEGFLCHLGFTIDDQPYVIPTLYARKGDAIYIHGSSVSRMLKRLNEGVNMCIAVTIVDGIVLARSAFHHSMNYRSAVVFGKGKEVTAEAEKLEALRLISENVLAGRWEDARPPTKKEMVATKVIEIEIEDASAKIREGDPLDDMKDYDLPIWAGVLPIKQSFGKPIEDGKLEEGIPLPKYLQARG